ncbi:MAG: hypothetical protein R2706_21135 [Acidimicrobiales bacterium]
MAERAGSGAIKFNVGNVLADQHHYAERIAEWLDALPPTMRLLCECHHGISIAEDPAVAAAIFDAAGPATRLQAIVHTHESDDHLRTRFDAYGDRISHVHVNFLNFTTMRAPRLIDIQDEVEAKVALLHGLGFQGSWTIEFTEGVLTANDNPDYLLARAADDLAVLRGVLAKAATRSTPTLSSLTGLDSIPGPDDIAKLNEIGWRRPQPRATRPMG